MPLNVCGSMVFNTELPSAWVILAQMGKLGTFQIESTKPASAGPKSYRGASTRPPFRTRQKVPANPIPANLDDPAP